MDAWRLLHEFWHYGVAALTLLMSGLASGHALLYKRDSRAAVAWVGLVWLVPLVGAMLYLLLGINRIRRRALELRGPREQARPGSAVVSGEIRGPERALPPEIGHLTALARVVDAVALRPLLPGNRVEPLINGDTAYPAMLQAIAEA